MTTQVNILLVDDRPENLIALESVLAERGQNVITATSGAEALRRLLDTEFAVVLMDVQMPGMDGFETARMMRARERTQHVPIVFLTAISKSDAQVFQGYSLGAVDYVFKPFSPEILKAKVASFVELSRKTLALKEEVHQRERAEEQVRRLNLRLERRVRERTAELESANRELEQEIAERRRGEEERSRLLELERHARAEAEAAQHRLAFLGEASAVLAGSLDWQTTVASVPGLAVPYFADLCLVDLLQEDGRLAQAAEAHSIPTRRCILERLRKCRAGAQGTFGSIEEVRRSGIPQLQVEVDDTWLAAQAAGADLRRAVAGLELCSFMAVPLVARGETVGVISFGYAESGRRYHADDLALAEDLARRAAAAVENARLFGEIQETARRKDEFLAMLAHELRNPLAAISNASLVLEQTQPSEDRTAQLRSIIFRQSGHLSRLVDDLLDAARISAGKIDLRKTHVELSAVVQQALEACAPQLEACGHQLIVGLPPEPIWLYVDPTRMEQVLWNLLNNAAKYTEPGGKVWLTADRAAECRPGAGSEGGDYPERGYVAIRVRDTGIGIPRDLLGGVFDLFTQADRSLDRSQGGLGIGLALVKSLVQLHGGDVSAASDGPGKGSEFAIRLPVVEAPRKNAVSPGKANPGVAASNGRQQVSGGRKRQRVLVVEDNLDAAETLSELIEMWGHEVQVALTGPMALESAAAYAPDLVLLDIGLPGMDGYEVARRLRELPELSLVKIVALTGYGQESNRKKSLDAGFDQHLTKPVEPAALEALLSGALTPGTRLVLANSKQPLESWERGVEPGSAA